MTQRLVENTLHTLAHFRLYRLISEKLLRATFRSLSFFLSGISVEEEAFLIFKIIFIPAIKFWRYIRFPRSNLYGCSCNRSRIQVDETEKEIEKDEKFPRKSMSFLPKVASINLQSISQFAGETLNFMILSQISSQRQGDKDWVRTSNVIFFSIRFCTDFYLYTFVRLYCFFKL